MRSVCVFWLGLLAVLAVAGQPVALGSNQGRTVSFDLYRDYLIVARGSAGPLKGLNFMLDTGATPSVIDRRVAEKLHLQELSASIAVIGGSVQGGQSVVPSLELGPVRRENLPVLVEDLSFFQKAFPVRIDAIVGLDLLGQSPFVIDYREREIHFGPLPVLATSLSLHMQGGLPIVDGELNDEPVHLLVDTGASSLILFGRQQPRSPSPMKISVTIGDFDRKQVRLQSLKLGEANFGREAAFFVEQPSDRKQNFDGLMSPAALGITKLAIDGKQGLLAFTR
jgi:predicted aspartyl protease